MGQHRKYIKQMHNLPDAWLTSRAVEWMLHNLKGNWWIMSFTGDGTPVSASYGNGVRGIGNNPNGKTLDGKASPNKPWFPSVEKQLFAKDICEALNLENNNGGAWMAGFVSLTVEDGFYLIWKDFDGDIQLDIEFPQTFKELSEKWNVDDFINHSYTAIESWGEQRTALELRPDQICSLAH